MNNQVVPAPYAKTVSRNPIVTSIFTADPSAHAWDDGKIYIYASHDMDPARGCDLMDRYHVFSSEDMVNWVDEGEILRSDNVSWGRPEGGFMWAPDCAYRNGTYYFYYPHPSGSDWNATWKIGVAASDKPAGGFVDCGYMEGLGGFAMIDPCVFVDDDNRAYMYYGGGSRCEGGELNDDMMSINGEMREMAGLEDFHEAVWVFKRKDIYYLTYADNLHGRNQMRYSTSRHPLGPWTYGGIFLEPTGCDTTHGSVARFKGEWYLFYHNQDISNHGNLRSMCVDRLYFDEDGSIRTVVPTREGGITPVGPAPAANPAERSYGAELCEAGGGATVETNGHGETFARGLAVDGAYIRFEGIDGGAGGRAAIRIRYATAERLAKLSLTVNGQDWSLLNALSTGSDDDFAGWTTLTVPLNPGLRNEITLTGGHGAIAVAGVTVSPIGD